MAQIDLNRRFSRWEEKSDFDPDAYQFLGHVYGTLEWATLLERHRVVVLAEAGSGKTTEFKTQNDELVALGKYSFLATLRDVAERGFETALGKQRLKAFEEWKLSDQPCWIFIDSVDEAKARGALLETALTSLADHIGSHLDRVHILLSGRHSDWEFRRDLGTFEATLPIPATPVDDGTLDANEIVLRAIRRSERIRASPPETPLVVLMMPLNKAQVEAYVRGKGIENFNLFFEALTDSNLLSFARRPLDLQWLVDHWQEKGRFGSLNEMLTLSLDQRLKETDPSRARKDPLSLDASRQALQRIGAALVLQRLDSIEVPDENFQSSSIKALRLERLLPDWSSADRPRLITRSVFNPANAGFVRIHNDNQGSVRAFLAARWLDRLRAANCPREAIHELLFANSYGIDLIKPSMRQTAAWLSILDEAIAREVIARDPWALLDSGDPASLSLDVRCRALSAVIEVVRTDKKVSVPNMDGLQRFAKPDLAPFIHSMWRLHKEEIAPRELLLQIIWLGELTACADLAKSASFGNFPDFYSQLFAGRALIATAGVSELDRYALYLIDHLSPESLDLFWDGVTFLFPKYISVADLIETMKKEFVRNAKGSFGLTHLSDMLVDKIASPQEAAQLLALLMPTINQEVDEAGQHHLFEMFESCALRLLDLTASEEPPQLAVDAYLLISKVELNHQPRPYSKDINLAAAIRSTPARRRALFWRAVNTLTVEHGGTHARITDPYQLDIGGVNLDLSLDDIHWLTQHARDSSTDLGLVTGAAMRIWRDNEKPEAVLRELEAVGESKAEVRKVIEHWTAPIEISPELLELRNRSRQRVIEGEAQAQARDKSWIDFAENLRADPAQLRNCSAPTATGIDSRLLDIWQILTGIRGSQSRYSNCDMSGLSVALGDDVAKEFSRALMSQWRLWEPTSKADKPMEQRNSIAYTAIIGILGLSLEAANTPDWPSQLTDKEVELAVTYATVEINGYPTWTNTLSAQRPRQVQKVLSRYVEREWYPGPFDMRRGLLDDVSNADACVCATISEDVMAKLEKSSFNSVHVLEPALRIVGKGLADRDRLAKLSVKRFSDESDVAIRVLYLGSAFAINAEQAAAALDEVIAKLPVNEKTELAQKVMPVIFGSHWDRSEGYAHNISTPLLERLVNLAYETIRVTEDNDHGDGVYSPDDRDKAEGARTKAFNLLVNRSGAGVFAAIHRMAQNGNFGVEQNHLRELAYRRAASDAESAEWTSTDVVLYESDFTRVPRTPIDLQRVVLGKLSNIQHELLHGDFNQGVTVARLIDEVDVQNWFANELKQMQGRGYSLEREPHVNREKEPDIRIRARETDASLPIEIKVAETWSLAKLEEGLTSQLMGRYLLNNEDRWGIYLVVHQTARPKGWEGADGNFLTIEQVIDHLQLMAQSIGEKTHDAPRMVVFCINVSSVPR